MSLVSIWAQGHNRAIGKDGTMAWHVPEDMALFRRVTMGHPVIMGRTTWESLGPKYQPLPGRDNYVLTSNKDYEAPGARVVHSLAETADLIEGLGFVMGGAQVYDAAMDIIDGIIVTDLDIHVDGADAFAPALPDWEIVAAEPDRGWLTAENGTQYRFTALARPGTHPFGPDPLRTSHSLSKSERL